MTNTTNTPKTYAEAIAAGYRAADAQPVHIAGGSRRGALYVLLPAWGTSQYCIRQYLAK